MAFSSAACSVFETREPEAPLGNGGMFIVPTTPNIVIENLLEAFNNKDPDNYYNCFSTEKYVFTPSVEVSSRYPSLFSNWQAKNERQYIISNCAAIEKESNPYLHFETSSFDFISADSAILITNYTIFCNIKDKNIPNDYAGKMILTMVPEKSGLWSISSFQDFKNETEHDELDPQKNSWSQLKAYFSN